MSKETIKHAAVKAENGWVFMGKCHADCFHKAHFINVPMMKGADAQGFITSKGRFVSRKIAAEIAVEAKQVDNLDVTILFSEELWSPADNGKYAHCEIRGYYLPDTSAPKDEG